MAIEEIVSPLPGTFYRRPSPEEPPFKEEGADVSDGDVIGLVEVMKSFHQVKSDKTGKIKKFIAENEEPIMAGQVIAEIEV